MSDPVDNSTSTPPAAVASPCPRCGEPLLATTVRTAVWQGDAVTIVEDIPAHVCAGCMEQFYDDSVSDALRRLAEEGFPSGEATRQMTVPVFSLTGRIRRRVVLPDDSFVD
jgi:YgiT-type zinc finger domain-containing protein